MRETDTGMAKWERQTKVWPNERDRQKYGQMRETDKSMAKWERQTKVWPNEQKDKQRTSKLYIENYKLINNILTKNMQSITITDYYYPWNQVKRLLNIESPLSPWYIETPIHGISILYHEKLNPFLT
jgi:hypothetical protein